MLHGYYTPQTVDNLIAFAFTVLLLLLDRMSSYQDVQLQLSAAPGIWTLKYWEDRWKNAQTTWHETSGNDLMWENFDRLVETNFPGVDKASLKVFVPLCGKTYDMYRLYKEGYTVVGVEFASQPIREFFSENSIEVKSEVSAPYTASSDGRMTIGQGDLFTFGVDESAEHKLPHHRYDIIWDRASFESVNVEETSKYPQLMLSIVASNFLYLIDVNHYDTSLFGGPPLSVSQQDLEESFSPYCDIQLVASIDMSDGPLSKFRGLTYVTESLYTMVRKS